ncbi:hypothetical protein, partial [Salmonella sp. s51228]|uniref:hypothetical protein n=1 Tax=Salmonella sp. s51228 TaxID=3159652 RepID=UPI00397EA4EC
MQQILVITILLLVSLTVVSTQSCSTPCTPEKLAEIVDSFMLDISQSVTTELNKVVNLLETFQTNVRTGFNSNELKAILITELSGNLD